MEKIATAEQLATELRSLLAYVESAEAPSRAQIVASLGALRDRVDAPHGDDDPVFPFSRDSKPEKALALVLETLAAYKRSLMDAHAGASTISQAKYAEEQVTKARTALTTLERFLYSNHAV